MSLQTAPVTLTPIPTELIAPLLPCTAFIFLMAALGFSLSLSSLGNLCCLCIALAKH